MGVKWKFFTILGKGKRISFFEIAGEEGRHENSREDESRRAAVSRMFSRSGKWKRPKPGPADVLIRVASCAICSSDLSLIAHPWPGQPPYGEFIPGHEYSGVIAAKGETVDEFRVGDRVSVEAHYGCGRCRNCRRGNYTSCLNYGKREKGHRANGFTTNGGYAQYVVNHVNTVYPIPDSVGFEEASLITNLGCVLYGFETIGGYIVGDQVAVIGPGPLGTDLRGSGQSLVCGEGILDRHPGLPSSGGRVPGGRSPHRREQGRPRLRRSGRRPGESAPIWSLNPRGAPRVCRWPLPWPGGWARSCCWVFRKTR